MIFRLHTIARCKFGIAFTEFGRDNVSTLNLPADSGAIVDPTDSSYKITYAFDRVKILAADILISFFDAFAIVAENNKDERDANINAPSASGNCAIHIH